MNSRVFSFFLFVALFLKVAFGAPPQVVEATYEFREASVLQSHALLVSPLSFSKHVTHSKRPTLMSALIKTSIVWQELVRFSLGSSRIFPINVLSSHVLCAFPLAVSLLLQRFFFIFLLHFIFIAPLAVCPSKQPYDISVENGCPPCDYTDLSVCNGTIRGPAEVCPCTYNKTFDDGNGGTYEEPFHWACNAYTDLPDWPKVSLPPLFTLFLPFFPFYHQFLFIFGLSPSLPSSSLFSHSSLTTPDVSRFCKWIRTTTSTCRTAQRTNFSSPSLSKRIRISTLPSRWSLTAVILILVLLSFLFRCFFFSLSY